MTSRRLGGIMKSLTGYIAGQQTPRNASLLRWNDYLSNEVQSNVHVTTERFQPRSTHAAIFNSKALIEPAPQTTGQPMIKATESAVAGNAPSDHYVPHEGGAKRPIQWAYHVTNVSAELPQPQWQELLWSPVENLRYNGKVLHQAPALFFTTTTWRNDIPTRSIYPLRGKKGEKYWCVKVPIAHFNCYKHILWVHKYEKQVKLFLALDEEVTGIDSQKVDELKAIAEVYFRKESNGLNDYKYYSNDYADDLTKYFLNFAVCHNFKLCDGVEWIQMAHVPEECGYRGTDCKHQKKKNDEGTRNELFKAFQNRINSML